MLFILLVVPMIHAKETSACGALASPARAARIELQPNPEHRERDAEALAFGPGGKPS